MVGEPDQSHGTGGKAFVFLGSASGLATTPAWQHAALGAADEYGRLVTLDANGDGYGDVVVSGHNGAGGAGYAELFLGGPAGLASSPAWTVLGGAGASLGASLSSGDWNCDGLEDVALSDGAGTTVHAGTLSGLGAVPIHAADGTPGSGTSGDHDGDGCDDLALGHPNAVHRGTPAGPVPAWEGPVTVGASNPRSAGDVDADGVDDLVVGDGDQFRVFFGSPIGPFASAGITLPAGPDAYVGSGVGDTDGDGVDDLAVAAFGVSGNLGEVWVYAGRADGTCDP